MNDQKLLPDIPEFGFLKDLEAELGIRKGFFEGLFEEDDWSFVIKLHALLEAATTHLLVEALHEPELRDIFSRLELSNLTTGKLAFVERLGLLDRDSKRYIQKVSELRNGFVHDVTNVDADLRTFFSSINESDRKGFYKAFRWGYGTKEEVKVKVTDDEYSWPELMKYFAIVTLEYLPKMAIWFGSIIILRHIYTEIEVKRISRQEQQLMELFLDKLLGLDSEAK